MIKKLLLLLCCLAIGAGTVWSWRNIQFTDAEAVGLPTTVRAEDSPPEIQPMTLRDVVELAHQARRHMSEHLDDYTARFIKQDRNIRGVLQEQEEMAIKVMTRLRGDTETAPFRIYLKFVAPERVAGREVIYREDKFDAKMVVHEVGLLGFKKLFLDPHGLLAMQDQRHPITNAGMVHLIEDLMEEAEPDLDNPHIRVVTVPDFELAGQTYELIQIHCDQPRGTGEEDYALAEIVLDRERMLLHMYRSFGFPEHEGDPLPLIESYQFLDVETNVGLTEQDFEPDNPEYNFPAL